MGIGVTWGGETAEEPWIVHAADEEEAELEEVAVRDERTIPHYAGTLPHRTEREKPGAISTSISTADRARRRGASKFSPIVEETKVPL